MENNKERNVWLLLGLDGRGVDRLNDTAQAYNSSPLYDDYRPIIVWNLFIYIHLGV